MRLSDVRPEVREAVLGRDRDGAPTLHKLSPLKVMANFHAWGLKRREVPERFWFEARDRDDYAHAVVSCPCDRCVVAELLAHPAPCDGCQRAYFYDGTTVWALNSPGPRLVGVD